jgi:hypothetical protein
MTALRANFVIEQGTTFDPIVRLKIKDTDDPVDLTGFTALMQIRKTRGDTTVLVQLSTDSLPEDDGTITIDGPNGTLALLLEHTETALLDFEYGVYDIILIAPSGRRSRPIEGSITFSAGSTQE